MLLSFQSILPLFLMIALGYVAKRTIFNINMLPGLNQFVYYLAVPALLFNAASKASIDNLINGPALAAFFLGAIVTAIIVVFGSRMFFKADSTEQLVLRALNGTFANYAYMGIPLTFAIFGNEAYAATVSIILAGNIFLIGGAQLLIESIRQKELGLRPILAILDRSLLRNPIFISTLLGLLFSANQVSMPAAIHTLLDMLAPAAIPVALFCLGASLQFAKTTIVLAELGWLVLIKLCIHPALTLAAFWLLDVEAPIWLATTVLLTALPTGALAHVVALKYDVFEKETSQIVVVTTVFSLLSVTLWMSWLQ
ncbi:AEC family transporter [Neptunomonas japonica]|uniref:Auxin efflux carrier n=1 Tax=Neptunomonas japonica JAMM 1380 TaxID=1441457 RepID=A0A7R6PSM2_9GAMM|nr:AEC family transporter [Neptunomonas japonica]BBB29660.1 auxin efflux carrier [Neptunomonas japonica JAMM 1380]